jgi:hypothetical protein
MVEICHVTPGSRKRELRWPIIAWMVAGLAGCAHYDEQAALQARAVERQNELEAPNLVKKIPAETFRLDLAVLNLSWLIEMLSQRNVQMIEIVPGPVYGDPQLSFIASTDDWPPVGWRIPVARYMFVQLRLSSRGDPSCVQEGSVPGMMPYHEPLHPQTCLSMKISPTSVAQFRIRYLTAQEAGGPYARWAMVDSQTGATVASLPTVDSPSRGTGLSRSFVADSRMPYVTLLRLIDNRDAPRAAPYRSYFDLSVQAEPSPARLGELDPSPEVDSTYQLVKDTEVAGPAGYGAFDEKWRKAVADAEQTGWGYEDGFVVDQRLGVRHRLTFANESVYKILAADRGFYVFPWDWSDAGTHRLARYDLSGRLEWKVGVRSPAQADGSTKCSIGPFAIRSEPDALVLEEERCDHQVRRIVIDKRELARTLQKAP